MNMLKFGSWLILVLMVANFIPFQAQSLYAQTARSSESAMSQAVNVNTASIEELQAVRGIGPALAERIVEHRSANGNFESLDDLLEIRGIGSAKLEKIKSQITL